MTTLDLFRHDFVLSIRPAYAWRIVDGDKTVELRRRFPFATVTGALMYVYATAPVQAVIGYAKIAMVEERLVEDIWKSYSDVAYIGRDDFDSYYDGRAMGFVIKLSEPIRIPRPVPLEILREHLDFTPPQSFAYADDAFRRLVLGTDE